MKKWLKRLAWIVGSCVVLVLVLAGFTQTRICKDWLRDKIVQEASNQLNGSLEIGRIDGNLISDFELSKLLLKSDDDTLAFLPKLSIRLEPGKLLDSKVSLRVVALDSPYVKLRQRADSLWNTATLIKESEPAPAETEPFAWQIVLQDAALNDADIRFFPIAEIPGMPQHIYGLQARLSANYRQDSLHVRLQKLAFRAQNPDFTLQKLGLVSTFADSILTLKNVQVALEDTRLDAEITMHLSAKPSYRFDMKAEPADLDGLARIVPELGVAGKPNLRLSGMYVSDSLHFQLELTEQQSHLKMNGKLANLANVPRFDLNGTFEHLQLARWYPALDSLQLQQFSGGFALQGHGNAAENVAADLNLELRDSHYQGMILDRIKLAGKYQQGDAKVTLTGNSAFGQFSFSGTFKDILKAQRFHLSGQVTHADVGKAMAIDSLQTDINLTFTANGRGFHPDSAIADVNLQLSPSKLAGLALDTLFFSARVQESNFAIDTLQIESAVGDFYAAGSASMSAENDLRFYGKLGDMRWIAARVGADTLRVNGELDGQVNGRFQALNASLTYRLAEISYNEIKIDSLSGQSRVRFFADSLQGSLVARLKKSSIAEVTIDSLAVETDFSRDAADVRVALRKNADLNAALKATVQIDSLLQIAIADFQVQFKDQKWVTPSNQAKMIVSDSVTVIDGFALTYRDQRIGVGGTLRQNREQSLKLFAENFDLPTMTKLIDPAISGITGRLRADASMTGTLTSPIIDAKVQVQRGTLTKVKYDSLNVIVGYRDAQLRWLYQIYWQEKLTLRGDGFLPMDLMAPDTVEMVKMDEPFRFQIASSGIDLSFLQAFIKDVKNLNGLFVCDVSIENTLNDPEPVGHVSVFDGTIGIPQFGMNYRDIQIRLMVDKETIRVTEFDIGTETKVIRRFLRRNNNDALKKRADMRGRMWVEPGSYIDFDSTGFLGGVDSMSMKLRANQFLLANNSDYQAQINADVNIFGNVREPRFDGKMTVLRSSLYLPALEATGIYDEERIQSLLTGAVKDTVVEDSEVVEAQSSDYFSNLRGSLKIEIPKNAWVRGPDMNIELAGTLDLVKDGPEFEQPFGTIQVIRGTYDLFNAYKFDIEDGSLFFEGGQEFNPNMDIQAKHTIRTQNREIHDLQLHVTNRMFSPEMKFYLDDEPVEITEALRFLVTGGYGKGGSTQSTGLFAANGGKEATGMLAGMLTSQLSRFLLSSQVLDVLEVKGDLTGEQASIVLGKYITNKLFLSLEKAINLGSSNDEGISDEITVEYALSRYLILQAIAGDERTTGFDVFWKFSK